MSNNTNQPNQKKALTDWQLYLQATNRCSDYAHIIGYLQGTLISLITEKNLTQSQKDSISKNLEYSNKKFNLALYGNENGEIKTNPVN